MNSILAQENRNPATFWGRTQRWLPLLLIVIAAVAYYGSYWQYWFNPHDEGGTVTLGAQRLLHGERPWVDVELGYNIGWFYPIVGLFHLTGVNYLAVRAWFFLLSTLTAVLGCATVTKATGNRWLGLGTGLALIALPGSQFKNYIQLAEMANTACLIHLLFVDPTRRWKWLGSVALGGVVLGLTYLVRIELGFFFSVIWTGLLLLTLLDQRLSALARLRCAFIGALALVVGFAAAQAPAYLDMRGRGLESVYLARYSTWFDFLSTSLRQQVEKVRPPEKREKEKPALAKLSAGPATPAPATPEPAVQAPQPVAPDQVTPPPAVEQAQPTTAPATTAAAAAAADEPTVEDSKDASTLARRPVSAIWSGHVSLRERTLAFLTYAPFLTFAFFFIVGCCGLLWEIMRNRFSLDSVPLRWLLLIGGSLTTFPQFFFFRPDRPHLSEFMTGYIAALAACTWLLWPRGETKPIWRRGLTALVGLFLLVQLAVYTTFAMQHPSAGTIAARSGRKVWFKGENGVNIRCSKREAAEFTGVYQAVTQNSKKGDYLICFPYMPGYNVMTDRPTYLRDVYVDNATRSSNWSADTIYALDHRKPAVVIIDDRAINGNDASRFSRWAASVYAYLDKNYHRVTKIDTVEVFARQAAAPTAPEAQ